MTSLLAGPLIGARVRYFGFEARLYYCPRHGDGLRLNVSMPLEDASAFQQSPCPRQRGCRTAVYWLPSFRRYTGIHYQSMRLAFLTQIKRPRLILGPLAPMIWLVNKLGCHNLRIIEHHMRMAPMYRRRICDTTDSAATSKSRLSKVSLCLSMRDL